jgi:hypothetical protein
MQQDLSGLNNSEVSRILNLEKEEERRILKVNEGKELASESAETLRAASETDDGVTGQPPERVQVSIIKSHSGLSATHLLSGDKGVEYVRADFCDLLQAEIKRLQDERNQLAVKGAEYHTAAKAALEYVDNMNEDTPVDPNCKDCIGRVFFTKGTPEPPLCWIHQLEKVVKEAR